MEWLDGEETVDDGIQESRMEDSNEIKLAAQNIDMALGLRTFATIRAVINEGDFVSAAHVAMALLRLKKNPDIKESVEYLLAAIALLMSDENDDLLLRWFALHLRNEVMLLTAKERLKTPQSL